MFSFLNKKQVKSGANILTGNDDLQKITEELYKQNLETALKNKTLSLLDKLYEISILGLGPKELSEKMSSVIKSDFNFELVGIFLLNQEKSEIIPLSISESERLEKILKESGTKLESINIPVDSSTDFLKNVIENKAIKYTEDTKDIWGSLLSSELLLKIKSESHIRSSIVYPIIIENKAIGFFVIGINRVFSDIIDYEKDSIKSFADVISVALEKALIYEKLKITNIQLADANAGQANLIHIMNHQVKGHLGINKNIFAELLTDDYGQIPEKALPLIQKGLEESDLGVKYVTAVLRGASAENGTLPYEMKDIDIKTLISNVVEKQKAFADKKGLVFEYQIDEGNYNITGDATQLGEAIKNLIDNSISYTPKGTVWLALTNKNNKIMLSVKDTGVGIKEEDKPKIFKAGGVSKDSIKINVNSSGYGLVFVKGVIEAHKGKIWFESAGEGKGSTFFAELPTA